MIRFILETSLRVRGIVITLACLLLVLGGYSALHAKLDVFPDFVPSQVVIQTEAPGLAPEQVEQLVTVPLESTLSGLGGMTSLRSESIQGLSIITAVFQDGSDVFRMRQMVGESLSQIAGELPDGVKAPKMSPLTSSTMDVLKIGLVSSALTPMELRSFADWTLKPRLLAVPGVAKASVFGGEVRQLQIQVKPERLLAHGLSLSDLVNGARSSTTVLGAGFVEAENQRVVLQTEGQALSAKALADTVVARRDGRSIRLGDVAEVTEAAAPKFGDTLIQGGPGVLLTLSNQYDSNIVDVTEGLDRALAELAPVFEREGITVYPALHRPATFVLTALGNIRHSLLLGAVLVAIVLFLLLGNPRTALISLAAIPLSLLTAVAILERLGITINTITLGGLAIAIGEVVDDAIIDVENITRRLRENRARANPLPAHRVVLQASLEVRRAVVFATFVVVLVFVPLLTLTGLAGKFFAPLGVSYVLAILASLGVALTVTPALALTLFGDGAHATGEPRLQAWLKARYHRLLVRAMRRPRALIAGGALACAAALLAIPGAKGDFLPAFREGHFVLQVTAAPGTSLPEMLRMGRTISKEVLAIPGVATVEQQAGRAEQGEDPWGPNRCEFHVELNTNSGPRQAEIEGKLRSLLESYPGVQSEVLTFLGDRIGESLTGETADVVVNIFGDDLDALDAKAREVADEMKRVPGAADVRVKSTPGSPQEAIRLRPDRMALLGFQPAEVLAALQTAYQGTVTAQTYQGNQVTDVVVILDESDRRDPDQIGSLLVSNADGARVALRELADVRPASGRESILHEGGRRRQTVTANPAGRDVTSFVAEAKRLIAARVKMPGGLYLIFSGTAEETAAARRELFLHSAMAGVGVMLLLSIAFRSRRNLLLVLANVPFAMVGGVLAVFLSRWLPGGGGLTLGSLVGFVTLFGITMRNSIMLISHYEDLVSEEGAAWNLETAIRGASDRVVPILITALVTGLGLMPLALAAGSPGREIEGPMAIVIVGGLFTSTALNLLVLPTLAHRYGRFEGRPESAGVSGAAD